MKTIKRYANRKLYDTETSTYVTLDEIAGMVKEGVEFRIFDKRTKTDITSVTLAQILCEEEKKQSHVLSLQTLRSLIRTGEHFFQRRVRDPFFEMRDRTQETMERFMGRGAEEGEEKKEVPSPAADIRPLMRDLLDGFQRTMDDSLRALDDQLRGALDGLTHLPEVQRELVALREKIEGLESRMARLEQVEQPAVPEPAAVLTEDRPG